MKMEEEKPKPKASRRKYIIKTRVRIDEVVNRKQQKSIHETKSCVFFEKVKDINKLLNRLPEKGERGHKLQISEMQ